MAKFSCTIVLAPAAIFLGSAAAAGDHTTVAVVSSPPPATVQYAHADRADALAFFQLLVDRYRRLVAYEDVADVDFAAEGVYFTKADNDRIAGKQQVHKRLKPEIEVDKETGEVISQQANIMIAYSCKNFWRTMPLLHEAKNNPDDIDTDQEDHIYDDFRYACMSRPMSPKKVVRINPDSFQAARTRLIRAKKMAKRCGISVSQAYGRIR